jgi:phosphonate transport system ATP-binding protein
MTNPVPIIQLKGVEVHAGGRSILSINRLALFHGERVAFIGNSGAGKTTLLRMIKGHITPSRGDLQVLGETLPIRDRTRRRLFHRQIGMIHQQFDLIGRETVWENVCHGRLGYMPFLRSTFGLLAEEDRQICDHAMQEVHLEGKHGRQARTLSGGEQQRVAIARAMAQDPTLLLADEPVSSLDPALAEDILKLLVSIDDLHPLTLLMSLHHPALARRYAGRIIAMQEGSIIWDGPAKELSDERIRDIYGRDWSRGEGSDHQERKAQGTTGWSQGPQDFAVAGG